MVEMGFAREAFNGTRIEEFVRCMYIADSSISMACEWAHVFCLCVWVFRVLWLVASVAKMTWMYSCLCGAESDFRSPVWFYDDCNPGNYLDILLRI